MRQKVEHCRLVRRLGNNAAEPHIGEALYRVLRQKPVTAATGTVRPAGIFRRLLKNRIPFMTGIMISVMMRSGVSSSNFFRPSKPFTAVMTS